MSAKTMPPIPPRPIRSQEKPMQGASLGGDLPKVPSRPTNRRIERSISPHGDRYAPSPLNEPLFAQLGSHPKSQLYNSGNASLSSGDLPRRPPSVSMPSIPGQEGMEYADVFMPGDDLATSPPQTRSIANDLHLHAPKPSLPVSSAKERVSTVTRTDSTQAAAHGIGKANSEDAESHQYRGRASFASQGSHSTERAPSVSESEHGIPEIGLQVPMLRNAGDVQAPSPAPYGGSSQPSIGFLNDGSKPRHHGRRASARGNLPADSYGLHGHGSIPNDRFEKLYYEKHPELLKRETGYTPGVVEKAEWALSSDDLNKIVRDTASRGAGIGTSPDVLSTPSEQIGYLASEEYAMRMSPRPHSHKAPSVHGHAHVDSPLKKESISGEATKSSEAAVESEAEEDNVVHVDAPDYLAKTIYGSGHDESKESLGHHGGTPREEDPSDADVYSAPILAEDEVDKHGFGYDLQPAVSPMHEHTPHHFRSLSASNSRPTSRPASIHGGLGGMRFNDFDHNNHHMRLEDLEEYEPLFPEEEKASSASKQAKPTTVAEKLKRPDLLHRKFPSQDVWEDAPSSLHYTATVSSPQLPEEKEVEEPAQPLHVGKGETPEQAFARRQEELAENEARDPSSFLNREKKPWGKNKSLQRPGKQRFPSRDIWEDTADSLQLTTTVSHEQVDERDILSPPEERPTTGAVTYHQEKAAAGLELGAEEGRATTGLAATFEKPQVPARPSKKPATSADSSPIDKVAPPLPSKPKPQVPARPAKSEEGAPLSKVTSASSARSIESDSSAAAAKPKPPVPSRPLGGKIAALQGGFLNELNKKLGVGPVAPKKEEPVTEDIEEKEKAPLPDARKGRARGPARRAPAKSPEAAAGGPGPSKFAFSMTMTNWSIDPEEGVARVNTKASEDAADEELESKKTAALPQAAPLSTNTAGQMLGEPAKDTTAAHSSSSEDTEAQRRHDIASSVNNQSDLPTNPADDPAMKEDEPSDAAMSESTATIKPAKESKEAAEEPGESAETEKGIVGQVADKITATATGATQALGLSKSEE